MVGGGVCLRAGKAALLFICGVFAPGPAGRGGPGGLFSVFFEELFRERAVGCRP